jgi:hypothetical protein
MGKPARLIRPHGDGTTRISRVAASARVRHSRSVAVGYGLAGTAAVYVSPTRCNMIGRSDGAGSLVAMASSLAVMTRLADRRTLVFVACWTTARSG